MDDRERHRQGMEVRRAVLGDAHVDRAEARKTDFNREFQDLIVRYAWGEIWSRPGLERRTRSMLVVAITASLGRLDELKLHLQGALNNGVSADEIKEVLMQTAIYAGVPAANTAFHLAAEIVAEHEAPPR